MSRGEEERHDTEMHPWRLTVSDFSVLASQHSDLARFSRRNRQATSSSSQKDVKIRATPTLNAIGQRGAAEGRGVWAD